MCTCLLAGKNATVSGRAMLAANNDWDGVPAMAVHVPRTRHAAGDTVTLTAGGTIPQIGETCGYSFTACRYDIGTRDKGWAWGLNDRGVAAAGTGASAFRDIPCTGALLDPDDVLRLILDRAQSARGGIRMIGELVGRYGVAPSGLDGCRSMATYAVADAEEAWFLELAPGDHWIAVRVPDDMAGMRANAFGTHAADLTDTENVMASPGLAAYARERGWWDGDERSFDFAAAYGAEESPNEWGPELDPMNMRRRWRVMELLSGEKHAEDAPEYAVRPDRRLRREDFFAILRDVYEGTEYDLTKAPAAGRYGDPFHDDPESYALCRHMTVASILADFTRPVMWTALSSPAASCYVPLYADIDSLPAAYGACEPGEENAPSVFWEFKELFYLTERRYEKNIALVRPALEAYERAAAERLETEAALLSALPPEERRLIRTRCTQRHISAARALCRELKTELEKRY